VSSLSAFCCLISFCNFSISSLAFDDVTVCDEIFLLLLVELSCHVVYFSMSGSSFCGSFSLVYDMVLLDDLQNIIIFLT
jgi:hypothetical protein